MFLPSEKTKPRPSKTLIWEGKPVSPTLEDARRNHWLIALVKRELLYCEFMRQFIILRGFNRKHRQVLNHR
jgi:hypothetical protein